MTVLLLYKTLVLGYMNLLRERRILNPYLWLKFSKVCAVKCSPEKRKDLALLMGTCQTPLAFVALNSEPQAKGESE